ncbi:MAG: transglutaminase-like domain-containing protein, partial [Candidatus Marinimicrobia bacterium]|nr:transglutaminase-like domain-containing protein [Candidatus Neomarinimicrobiota bacterium]
DTSKKVKIDLRLEKAIMERIELDFNKSLDDILSEIKKYYPDVSDEQILQWEKEKSLEMKIINGDKRYFKNSAPNLFRINKDAKNKKNEIEKNPAKSDWQKFLDEDAKKTINLSKETGEKLVNPARIKVLYTLTVNADVVPDGEIIRCWLPFPREGNARQTDIKLISTNTDEYILADNKNLQRTVYLEKPAVKGKPTEFKLEFTMITWAQYKKIDLRNIKEYKKDTGFYKKYTSERETHIIFTDEIKKLSKKIVGDETNPYSKAKMIFLWIDKNIPWASAREYSTMKNIPFYVLENRHGDCGMQTLLFLTLARYNGIPAKWQSGWHFHPGHLNLHDWGEFYLEGIGWVPVDQSFGTIISEDEKIANFYLGNIDRYRLIVNDDYSKPLFPSKNYPRSETVDFQRGEVEWKGGNLYFDKWDYEMKIEYLTE